MGRLLWLLGALLLTVVSGLGASNLFAVSPGHRTAPAKIEIYLFRGLFAIPGSRSGIAEIAATLRKRGMSATVHGAWDWRELATKVAAKYKRGQLRSIVLVGYSAGATSVADMATRLGELGTPVKLVIAVDPVWPTVADGRVDRFVNYYGRGMRVARGKQFKGRLQNVDLAGIASLDHSSLDTDKSMQRRVISSIRAVMR